MERNYDLLIIGAGPAGSALCSAASAEGLVVACLDPEPGHWPSNYASWADELPPVVRSECLRKRWPRTVMVDASGGVIPLERSYALIDNPALMRHLDAQVIEASVEQVNHDTEGARLETTAGVFTARLVVDASGTGAFLRGAGSGTAFQIAWGELQEAPEHGYDLDEMVLMDWRQASSDGPPSFVYVMPIDKDHLFVEETILACRPAVSPETLRARLDKRFVAGRVIEVERCVIPLDKPGPDPRQRLVGFGAAAGMVHPATGYQLARSLRQAPELARTIASTLDRGPVEAARAAWQIVAPTTARLTRRAHLYGLELLLSFDQRESSEFFSSFFNQPSQHWKSYLDADAGWFSTARAMASLFAADPSQLPTLIRPLGR